MSDDPVREALRSMPRVGARVGFAERVLARLDEPARRPSGVVRGLAWGLAAAAAVVIVVAGSVRFERQRETAVAKAQFDVLIREQRALAAELEALRQDRSDTVPVIYLGGDDRTDVVLDLGRLPQNRPAVRPASLGVQGGR